MPYLWVAFETYDFCSEFDDSINEKYFAKAVNKLEEASMKEDPRGQLEKIAAGYVFLGMAFYDDVIRPTKKLYAEIASHFDSKREKKLRLSVNFFVKAHNINKKLGDSVPSIPLRIGLLYCLLSEKDTAMPYFLEAKNGFAEKGDNEMAETVSSMLF